MNDLIRIGKVSTVDYGAGTASVTYTDRGGETSPPFPVFSSVYEMPKVDDTVVVILLANSKSKGFIVGTPFSAVTVPEIVGAGIFYKKFADGTMIIYDPAKKTLSVDAEEIELKSVKADRLTVKDLTVTGTATIKNIIVEDQAEGV